MNRRPSKGAIELSASDARRIALCAQGFSSRPKGQVDSGHLRRLLTRLGAIQIDAVNVVACSHYLVAYSRLGPYPLDVLDQLAYQRRLASWPDLERIDVHDHGDLAGPLRKAWR